MTIILYARVSTTRQAERELSIPAQMTIMKRYAADHGLIVAGSFEDVATGTSLRHRPGLMAAIRTATANRFVDCILVHKLDRLSRNTFNYLVLKSRLKEHGVRIISVVESIEATPMGEFMEHIMAAQAEFYSANLGAEVRKGLDERLRRGLWNGSPPLGYLMRDSRLVPDPARAPFIREAFTLWASGVVTLRELARVLYERGMTSRTGKELRLSVLSRLLRNRIYLGEVVGKGEIHRGAHVRLLEDELFDAAQAAFARKHAAGVGPRKQHVFVLGRKLACPSCGAILVGESHLKAQNGKTYRYYVCQHCRGFRSRVEPLESAVILELQACGLLDRLKEAARGTSEDEFAAVVAQLPDLLLSPDEADRRRAVDAILARVELSSNRPKLVLAPAARALLVDGTRENGTSGTRTLDKYRKTA